jgi:heme O synthase-like polyprenyltransferase
MARNDYISGGYKMLSCSDPRAAADTAVRHALAMSAMLFALPTVLQYGSVDPNISHTLGTAAIYGAGCTGLVWAKVALTRDITMEWAKKTFLFSLLVVPIIMAAGAVWWLVFSDHLMSIVDGCRNSLTHFSAGDTVSHAQNRGIMPARTHQRRESYRLGKRRA